MALISDFYAGKEYYIDEKIGFFKFTNEYKIYNASAIEVGLIKQKMSGGAKALSLLLSKTMLPFTVEIYDNNNQLLATIHRGWTLWMSKITIADANKHVLGIIKQKFKLFSSKFNLLNLNNDVIAEINGDWKAWNFSIVDTKANKLGSITKKWAGMSKELFTTADKYNITIEKHGASNEDKLQLVCTAITIDMVLKEAK